MIWAFGYKGGDIQPGYKTFPLTARNTQATRQCPAQPLTAKVKGEVVVPGSRLEMGTRRNLSDLEYYYLRRLAPALQVAGTATCLACPEPRGRYHHCFGGRSDLEDMGLAGGGV